jgi:hypothetical protein
MITIADLFDMNLSPALFGDMVAQRLWSYIGIDLQQVIEELTHSSTATELNTALRHLYDWADENEVYIETRTTGRNA